MLTRSVTVTHSDILLIGVVGFFEVVGRAVGGAVQQNSSNNNNNKRGVGGGDRKTKCIFRQLQLIRQNILLP